MSSLDTTGLPCGGDDGGFGNDDRSDHASDNLGGDNDSRWVEQGRTLWCVRSKGESGNGLAHRKPSSENLWHGWNYLPHCGIPLFENRQDWHFRLFPVWVRTSWPNPRPRPSVLPKICGWTAGFVASTGLRIWPAWQSIAEEEENLQIRKFLCWNFTPPLSPPIKKSFLFRYNCCWTPSRYNFCRTCARRAPKFAVKNFGRWEGGGGVRGGFSPAPHQGLVSPWTPT